MLVRALCSSLVFLSAASGLQFPVKRVQQRSAASSLSRRADGDNTTLSLQTAHDLIYITNITVQGVEYPVQLDSGSSDLWIKGDTSPLPDTSTTDLAANLTFGIGWVAGNVGYASAEFADISVSRQAFLDVTEANNPALGYGAKGLMGLGFTALSNIDNLVNGTGSSDGRSLLFNLFEEHEDESNFISFVLLTDSEVEGEMDGTFTLGEYVEEYSAVQDSQKIATFPETAPSRWNILMDAAIIGDKTFYPTTEVNGAPINRAVVLLDSGTSYSYVSEDFAEAIYGDVPGAYIDYGLGQWIVPCEVEIDMAFQFSGQVIPIHPLDVSPNSLTNSSQCVGSFVPQSVSTNEGSFDMLLGDNFLRAVYSVYDFGDFDSGVMGNPYVQLLNLIDPDTASSEFATARKTSAKTGIVYNVADTAISPITMSAGLSTALDNLSTLLPAVLGIVALNALIMLGLLVLGVWWMCNKRKARGLARVPNGRRGSMPLSVRNSYTSVNNQDNGEQRYDPVSMAITDHTLLNSPTSASFAKRKFDDNRPMSLASPLRASSSSDADVLAPPSASFQGSRPMSMGATPSSPGLDEPFTPPSSTGTLHNNNIANNMHTIPEVSPRRRPSFPSSSSSSDQLPPPLPAPRKGVTLSDRPMTSFVPNEFAPPRPAYQDNSGDRPRSMA